MAALDTRSLADPPVAGRDPELAAEGRLEAVPPAAAGTDTRLPPAGGRKAGRSLLFWLAIGWLAVVAAAAIGAGWLPIGSPDAMDLLARRAGPSAAHWLGTDDLGRDMLSRLVFGARISLSVGLIAPLIGLAIGGCCGMLAGYFRGRFESLVVGGIDVLLAFPPLVLALAMTTYLGASVLNITITLGILSIPAFARVTRAATLALAERDFVTAARSLGAGHARILLRELLPNVALPLGAFFLLSVAVVIVVEGALSFLGLGVPPPTPSWGAMIAEGRESLDTAPSIAFLPAGAMFLTVLSFNIVGDRLRALTDPRAGAS
ncbi:MAG TPA: ABC transporter permease [Stellaceae bacterium]|nr:ABC transporter permease [Stellaceae bacterium]